MFLGAVFKNGIMLDAFQTLQIFLNWGLTLSGEDKCGDEKEEP